MNDMHTSDKNVSQKRDFLQKYLEKCEKLGARLEPAPPDVIAKVKASDPDIVKVYGILKLPGPFDDCPLCAAELLVVVQFYWASEPVSIPVPAEGPRLKVEDMQRLCPMCAFELGLGLERLTPAQQGKIVKILSKYWRPGHRHHLTIAVIGWLLKRGINPSDIYDVIDKVTRVCKDEERRERLQQVKWHVEAIMSGRKRLSELRGKAGLREVFQALGKEVK